MQFDTGLRSANLNASRPSHIGKGQPCPQVRRSTIGAFAMALLGTSVLHSAPALAGGFYLQEQSAKSVGRANSGEAAVADGAQTIFYNPAGMTELPGVAVEASVHVLDATAAQRDTGSVREVPGLGTVPTGGSAGGNPFNNPIFVPNLYVSAQASDRLWLGLAVNSPFGLVVEYDDDFFGRYDSIRSELFTVNVQPSAAYQLTENLSVGAGVNLQYADAELTNALPQPDPTLPDGLSRLTGDDFSVGWNVGLAFEQDGTRIGAHYRSGIDHDLGGTLEIEGLAGPLGGANGSREVSAPVRIPDVASVAVRQNVGDNARLLASVTWYNWSKFKSIDVFSDGELVSSSEQNYRDTLDLSLGGEWDASEQLTLRTGLKYDETPTVDAFRTTRVPDGNRTWLAAGASYRSGPWEFSASYAHIFVDSTPINRTDGFFEGTPAALSVTTAADGSGNVDQIAFSIGRRF